MVGPKVNKKNQEDDSYLILDKFSPYAMSKGEAYMSLDQLRHFRRILEHWKAELMEDVDKTIQDLKSAEKNST